MAFTISPLELMQPGTLMYWFLFLVFRFALVQRFIAPARRCLARDGQKQRRNMRRELITDDELNGKIREEGLEDIADVKRIYLEADGEMSLIRNELAKQPR